MLPGGQRVRVPGPLAALRVRQRPPVQRDRVAELASGPVGGRELVPRPVCPGARCPGPVRGWRWPPSVRLPSRRAGRPPPGRDQARGGPRPCRGGPGRVRPPGRTPSARTTQWPHPRARPPDTPRPAARWPAGYPGDSARAPSRRRRPDPASTLSPDWPGWPPGRCFCRPLSRHPADHPSPPIPGALLPPAKIWDRQRTCWRGCTRPG
jgi:hypothetical protein